MRVSSFEVQALDVGSYSLCLLSSSIAVEANVRTDINLETSLEPGLRFIPHPTAERKQATSFCNTHSLTDYKARSFLRLLWRRIVGNKGICSDRCLH